MASFKRILGVDPGFGSGSPTGAGLFKENGEILFMDEFWSNKKLAPHKRLSSIAKELLVNYHLADMLCIESTVMRGKGGETLQRLIGAIVSHFPDTEVVYVQNTSVKKIVGGTGKATKEAVAKGVHEWFWSKGQKDAIQQISNLIDSERWDILDALAIGIAGFEKR